MPAGSCGLSTLLQWLRQQAVAESLFAAIQRQKLLSDSVIVSYSGGKESAVVLDLCSRHFKTVHAFFMYQVPNLSFQEAVLRWAEQRYGIEIYRIPHFEVSRFYRYGIYRKPDATIPILKIADIYAHVREVFGCQWIAAGERAADSVVRGARLRSEGSINVKRGRFFPLAWWRIESVRRYIQAHSLKVSPESQILGHSFRFDEDDIIAVKQHYPEDYERIRQSFPDIGAVVARRELYGAA